MSRLDAVGVDPLPVASHGAAGAARRTDRAATALLVAGGLLGVLQTVLPWARGESGWDQYDGGAAGTGAGAAGYAVLVTLACGIVMVAAAVAISVAPMSTRTSGRVALIAAIVAVACSGWWLVMPPRPLSDLFGMGSLGWYAFLLAGIVGVVGSARVLARRRIGFDRASFMTVFLGLPLVIFVVFVASPFAQAIYYSMTDWKGFSPEMNFTGLANYAKLLRDDTFRHAVVNNIKLGIVVPTVTIALALAIASLVTVGGPSRGPVRGIRASGFYRVISFFPHIIPAIVIGVIWAQVFDPARGILNQFLVGIGLDGFVSFAWLGGKPVSLYATMFVIIWSFVGFYAVLFIAAIKGVSAEVYEAARLDGAGRYRTAISVTIPLIRDTIQTAYIYLGIAALDAFVYMVAMNPVAGPETIVMSQDLYNTAFRKGQFGYATAMGVVLALVTLLFASLVFLINRWTGGGPTEPRRRRRVRVRAGQVRPAPAGPAAQEGVLR